MSTGYEQPIEIHYRDGRVEEIHLTQYSLGAFSVWANRQKINVDPNSPGLMAVLMLRYQAYAERFVAEKTKPSFDLWDQTVLEVVMGEPNQVDPTQPGPPAD